MSHLEPLGSVIKPDGSLCVSSIHGIVKAAEVQSGLDEFRFGYLADQILSKYVEVDQTTADARRSYALQKVLECELSCKRVNEEGYSVGHTDLRAILHYAQLYCSNILQDFSFSVLEKASFSSGASLGYPRRKGDPFYKYKGQITTTPRAARYIKVLVGLTPLWNGLTPTMKIVPGNRLDFVPKNAQTDRAIAIEPSGNMYLQKAVGTYIRKRLKFHGIDLNDQSVNQRLAREGSMFGRLATIDLSSASDTVSDRIVWDLLPPDWYSFLDDIRSHFGIFPDGSVVRWEKHSSMGNGYTFELESLIFAALCYGIKRVEGKSSDVFSVYGDDIIVPTSYVDTLKGVFEAVGFSFNSEKSFWNGPFRESCGKHYYSGHDVSPFYIRKPIDTITRKVWFLNKLREWSYCQSLQVCDPRLYPLWRTVMKSLSSTGKKISGGYDLQSVQQIVSPSRPSHVISFETRDRLLDGPSAVLRVFQMRNFTIRADHLGPDVTWDLSPSSSEGSDRITLTFPSRHKVRKLPASYPYDRRCIFLFPQEIFSDDIPSETNLVKTS